MRTLRKNGILSIELLAGDQLNCYLRIEQNGESAWYPIHQPQDGNDLLHLHSAACIDRQETYPHYIKGKLYDILDELPYEIS